jgi:hypothetical protein
MRSVSPNVLTCACCMIPAALPPIIGWQLNGCPCNVPHSC